MLTNAYVTYLFVNMSQGIAKKDLLSQHEFRRDIIIMWINPEEYQENEKMKVSSVSSVTMSTISSCTAVSEPSVSKKRRRVCDSALSEHGSM